MQGWQVCLLLATLAISLANSVSFQRNPGSAEIEICDELDAPEGREKWCYVLVRPGAHTFWWLYYSTHEDGWETRPLIIWLQGGPGSSSSGYGNFEIIGPLDLELEPRNYTWVQSANILFVDNPVGAGYSYVESDELFTQDVEEIAEDLLTMYQAFLGEIPDFREIPLYIFGQSYGGKMGSAFALRLHQAIVNEEIVANLAGFAMGNAWVSPLDSTLTWGPFLYYMSNLDDIGLLEVQTAAEECEQAANEGRWHDSTDLWRQTQYAVNRNTNYINFYNILEYRVYDLDHKKRKTKDRPFNVMLDPLESFALDDLMNGVIREKLGIIPEELQFGAQSDDVFEHQEGDFMKHTIDVVDSMLQTEMYDVVVYQGQLDLICDTKGALDFVNKFEWEGMNEYYNATKVALIDPDGDQTETFVKAYNHLKFYWNLQAGHAVPADVGWPALRMMNRIIDGVDT